jgi:glycosyltransferase involved in cell wall biosynthesis
MKNNKNTTPKEFDTLDDVQKMEISDEVDVHMIQNPTQNRSIAYALIAFTILVVIGLGVFLFIKTREEQTAIDLQNQSPNMKINQEPKQNQNIQLTQNTNGTLEYKNYELQNYIPQKLNLKSYKKFLPKNNKKKKILSFSSIFNNKHLYINNKQINYDYIYTIRQKDFKNNDKRDVSFQNDESDFSKFEKRAGQISLRDFYVKCDNVDQKNLGYKPRSYDTPLISIIISAYKKKQNLLRTIKSIENQSFKNLEIIIVDDKKINLKKSCKKIIEFDPRIRVFTQKESYGLWRKRMDGFLYSKGKYILHMDAGDILADNLVLEDIYNIAKKYDLDSVRFSFSKNYYDSDFIEKKNFKDMMVFPSNVTKIVYGRPGYDVHEFGYGTIWNRLVRADMFSKGLDLVDNVILNIKKDFGEDMWWNDLVDRVSFSNLIVNRLGYIDLYNKNITFEPLIGTFKERDKSINEFIYFWYFDLILLPKNDEKKPVINALKKFNDTNNTICEIPMKLSFLKKKSNIFILLIKKLLEDSYVAFVDKIFIKDLSDSIRQIIKNNKIEEKKEKAREKLEKERKKQQEKEMRLKMMNQTRYMNNSIIMGLHGNNSNHSQMIIMNNFSQINNIYKNQSPIQFGNINNQQINGQGNNQMNQQYNNNKVNALNNGLNQNAPNINFGKNNLLPNGNQMIQNNNIPVNNNQQMPNNQINQNIQNQQNNQNKIPIINNGNVINNKINNKIIPPIKERNSPNQNFNITSKDKL